MPNHIYWIKSCVSQIESREITNIEQFFLEERTWKNKSQKEQDARNFLISFKKKGLSHFLQKYIKSIYLKELR